MDRIIAGFVLSDFESFGQHLPAILFNVKKGRDIIVFAPSPTEATVFTASAPSLVSLCEQRNWSYVEFDTASDLIFLTRNVDLLHTGPLSADGHAVQAAIAADKQITKSTKPAVASIMAPGVFTTEKYTYELESPTYIECLYIARCLMLPTPQQSIMYTKTDLNSMKSITSEFFPHEDYTTSEPFKADMDELRRMFASVLCDDLNVSQFYHVNDEKLAALTRAEQGKGTPVFSFYENVDGDIYPTVSGVYLTRDMLQMVDDRDRVVPVPVYNTAGSEESTWVSSPTENFFVTFVSHPIERSNASIQDYAKQALTTTLKLEGTVAKPAADLPNAIDKFDQMFKAVDLPNVSLKDLASDQGSKEIA